MSLMRMWEGFLEWLARKMCPLKDSAENRGAYKKASRYREKNYPHPEKTNE